MEYNNNLNYGMAQNQAQFPTVYGNAGLFNSNQSLVAPADANVMQQPQFGLSPELQKADWKYSQPLGQPQSAEDKIAGMLQADQEQRSKEKMYEIMGKGIQNYAKGMQMQMPSGNTAQIFRDQSRPQFAGYVGDGQAMNPQQQMAKLLRGM